MCAVYRSSAVKIFHYVIRRLSVILTVSIICMINFYDYVDSIDSSVHD